MNKNFSNLSDRLEYYQNNEDYYFYKKLYSVIDPTIDFFNKKNINFTLIMTILLNKLFGNYNFFDRLLYLHKFDTFTKYDIITKINDIYNKQIDVLSNYIYFNKSLLSVDVLKDLYLIKDEFYSLSFSDRFDLIENFEDEIRSLFFLSSFIEYNSIDKNYFLLNNHINSNFTNIENSLMNNYFFKNYVNVKSINELYLSFSIIDNDLDNTESNFLLNEKKFIYYKNFIKKIYFKQIDEVIYIYSNDFKSSLNKKNKVMINIIKKNKDNIIISNVRKMITNMNNNQIKLLNMNNITDNIMLEYDSLLNMYYINDIVNENIFNINIKLAYSVERKIFSIIINNKVTDKLYYKIDNNNIYRIYDKYTLLLGKLNLNLFTFSNIIFPYEYIIIVSFISLGKLIQTKSIINKTKNKVLKVTKKIGTKNSVNQYEEQLLKELGKNKISKKDSQIKSFITKSTNKSLNEYIKELNKNAITSKTVINNINNYNKNLIEFMSNSNSILLNIHYYKLKYYEQNYYLNNIQNYYNVIKNHIFELDKKKEEDINNIKSIDYNKNDITFLFKDNINDLKKINKKFEKNYNDTIILYFYNENWLDYFINEYKHFQELNMVGGGKSKGKQNPKKKGQQKGKKTGQKDKSKSSRENTYISLSRQLQLDGILQNNNLKRYNQTNKTNNKTNNENTFVFDKYNIINILNKNLFYYLINLLSENYDNLNSNYIVQSLLNYINDEFNTAVKNFELYDKFSINQDTDIIRYNLLKLYYIINAFKIDYLKKYLDNFDNIQELVFNKISKTNKIIFNTQFKFDKNQIEDSNIVVKQYNIIDIHPDVEKFVITHSKLFKKFNSKYYYFNIFDFKKIINCLIIYKKKIYHTNNLNNVSIIINKNNFLKNKIKFNLINQFSDLDFNDFIDKKLKNNN